MSGGNSALLLNGSDSAESSGGGLVTPQTELSAASHLVEASIAGILGVPIVAVRLYIARNCGRADGFLPCAGVSGGVVIGLSINQTAVAASGNISSGGGSAAAVSDVLVQSFVQSALSNTTVLRGALRSYLAEWSATTRLSVDNILVQLLYVGPPSSTPAPTTSGSPSPAATPTSTPSPTSTLQPPPDLAVDFQLLITGVPASVVLQESAALRTSIGCIAQAALGGQAVADLGGVLILAVNYTVGSGEGNPSVVVWLSSDGGEDGGPNAAPLDLTNLSVCAAWYTPRASPTAIGEGSRRLDLGDDAVVSVEVRVLIAPPLITSDTLENATTAAEAAALAGDDYGRAGAVVFQALQVEQCRAAERVAALLAVTTPYAIGGGGLSYGGSGGGDGGGGVAAYPLWLPALRALENGTAASAAAASNVSTPSPLVRLALSAPPTVLASPSSLLPAACASLSYSASASPTPGLAIYVEPKLLGLSGPAGGAAIGAIIVGILICLGATVGVGVIRSRGDSVTKKVKDMLSPRKRQGGGPLRDAPPAVGAGAVGRPSQEEWTGGTGIGRRGMTTSGASRTAVLAPPPAPHALRHPLVLGSAAAVLARASRHIRESYAERGGASTTPASPEEGFGSLSRVALSVGGGSGSPTSPGGEGIPSSSVPLVGGALLEGGARRRAISHDATSFEEEEEEGGKGGDWNGATGAGHPRPRVVSMDELVGLRRGRIIVPRLSNAALGDTDDGGGGASNKVSVRRLSWVPTQIVGQEGAAVEQKQTPRLGRSIGRGGGGRGFARGHEQLAQGAALAAEVAASVAARTAAMSTTIGRGGGRGVTGGGGDRFAYNPTATATISPSNTTGSASARVPATATRPAEAVEAAALMLATGRVTTWAGRATIRGGVGGGVGSGGGHDAVTYAGARESLAARGVSLSDGRVGQSGGGGTTSGCSDVGVVGGEGGGGYTIGMSGRGIEPARTDALPPAPYINIKRQ